MKKSACLSKCTMGWKPHRYGMGSNPSVSPLVVDLGILGGGVIIGMISYTSRETPLGATMLGAGGSIAAVGLVLLARQLLLGREVAAASGLGRRR